MSSNIFRLKLHSELSFHDCFSLSTSVTWTQNDILKAHSTLGQNSTDNRCMIYYNNYLSAIPSKFGGLTAPKGVPIGRRRGRRTIRLTWGAHSLGCSASGKVVIRNSTGLVTSRLVTSSIASVRRALWTALLLRSQ